MLESSNANATRARAVSACSRRRKGCHLFLRSVTVLSVASLSSACTESSAADAGLDASCSISATGDGGGSTASCTRSTTGAWDCVCIATAASGASVTRMCTAAGTTCGEAAASIPVSCCVW